MLIAARSGVAGVTPRWAAAVSAALLPVLPVAWTAFGQRGQVGWLERPGLAEVESLVTRFAGTGVPLAMVVVLVVLGLTGTGAHPAGPGPLAPGAGSDGRRACRAPVGVAAVAVPLAVLPPALLLAVSQIHPFYQDRYVLFSMTGLALAVGAGLARAVRLVPSPLARSRLVRSRPAPGTASGWPRAATAVALPVLLAAAYLPAQAAVRRIDSRTDDPAAAARIVESGRRPGDAVLFLPSVRRLVAEAYPASFRGVRDVALRVDGARSGTLAGRELPPDEIVSSLGAAPRVWVVSRPHPAPADLSSAQDTVKRLLLREGYRRERTHRVLGYAVRLYTRLSP